VAQVCLQLGHLSGLPKHGGVKAEGASAAEQCLGQNPWAACSVKPAVFEGRCWLQAN
jgi:hypothetical protein